MAFLPGWRVIGSGADSEAPSSGAEDARTESFRETDSETAPKNDPPAPGRGHGRNGADAYGGAEKIQVPHQSLRPGDACPDCQNRWEFYDLQRDPEETRNAYDDAENAEAVDRLKRRLARLQAAVGDAP